MQIQAVSLQERTRPQLSLRRIDPVGRIGSDQSGYILEVDMTMRCIMVLTQNWAGSSHPFPSAAMQYAHNIDHILIIAAVLLFMTVFVKCLPIISKHLVCRCFTSLSGHAGNDCQTQPSCVLFEEELGNTFPWARFYSVRHSTASLSFLGRSE